MYANPRRPTDDAVMERIIDKLLTDVLIKGKKQARKWNIV